MDKPISRKTPRPDGGMPLGEPIRLRAGRLEAEFLDGTLYGVSVDGFEIVQQVYVALRDPNWNTIPYQLDLLEVKRSAQAFTLDFKAWHRRGEIAFAWRGRLTGGEDSRICFEMHGEALADFERNRIGFCCLHPQALAGESCELTHADGTVEASRFPELVAPHQPLLNLAAIRHPVPGGTALIEFTGDVFETEDQRNWTDASFKTYCTPLALPFPVKVAAGERVDQTVTISFRPAAAAPVAVRKQEGAVRLFPAPEVCRLPRFGIGLGVEEADAEAGEALRALSPAFVRLEVDAEGPRFASLVREALAKAARLGVSPRLALRIGQDLPEEELKAGAKALIESATLPEAVTLLLPLATLGNRARLKELLDIFAEAPGLGAGCDSNFAELNRNRPDPHGLKHVAFAANPQVHLFDNRSIMENLPGIAAALASAGVLAAGREVALEPLTLRPIRNPAATRREETRPGEPPKDVDPRQLSPFAAAWLVGAALQSARGGAAAVTFFTRVIGWRGVGEGAAGSPLPEFFPSTPGRVFPVFHALRRLCRFSGAVARLLCLERGEPAGCLVEAGGTRELVIFNPAAAERKVFIDGADISGRYYLSAAGSVNLEGSPTAPDSPDRPGAAAALPGEVSLPPYGTWFGRLA